MSVGNDRAWNDPPPLPLLDCQRTSSKKTMLNKRVAFPLHNSGGAPPGVGNKDPDRKATAEGILPAGSCPPVESNESNYTPCSGPQSIEKSSKNDATDEEMLLTILSTFNTLISSFAQLPKEDVLGIKRKIDIFTNFWNEKLSAFVKQKMFQLATEIAAGNIEAADKLHHSLVVSNSREVAPWMVGVKHIIQNAQKSAPEATADNNDPEDNKGPEELQVLDACTFYPDSGLNLILL